MEKLDKGIDSMETDLTKYYVVKHGRKPGIYQEFEEAKAQVNGFSKADLRKIKGLAAAKAYLSGEDIITNMTSKLIKPLTYYTEVNFYEGNDVTPNIYIDGSYSPELSVSSYGFVVEKNGEIMQKDFGLIMDKDMMKLKSFGAEMYACIRAIEWGIANNLSSIRLIYDCKGIVDLIKSGKAKCEGRRKFLINFMLYNKHLRINFQYVQDDKKLNKHHRISHELSRKTLELLKTAQ